MSNNRRGFTLIELVVAIGILVMVLSFIFSSLFFGMKTFSKSDSQYQLQSELRFAADFIVKELRNASVLTLLDSFVKEQGYHYIYVNNNNQLIYEFNTEKKQLTSIVLNASSFGLLKNGTRNRLTIALRGGLKDQSYDVTTEVLLNNIFDMGAASNKKVIKYKK